MFVILISMPCGAPELSCVCTGARSDAAQIASNDANACIPAAAQGTSAADAAVHTVQLVTAARGCKYVPDVYTHLNR